ncbi:hypothetical protein KIJ96_21460 (plasmid) [Pseudoalteromonas piscicida]|uniref:hypothetical protein n=1 Tax=Pseudoalteromonas piscicida TaxID=43662 RepID=UPI001D0B0652|nr:hypothetical protein [Pseudoalteromonas piscicida]UDM63526.1 hypothetical protein KIJ96_21460 [Pseudoalteromonas piscicida]
MNSIYENLVVFANLGTLSALGILYVAYIKSLNGRIASLKEKSNLQDKHLLFFKDKVAELEKQSPANIEKILNERIAIRESEISKLADDRNSHLEEIEKKDGELEQLKNELEFVKNVKSYVVDVEHLIDEDKILIDLSEYEFGAMVTHIYNYANVQALLDDLYLTYLHHEHPTYTYLDTWKLVDSLTGDVINSAGRADFRELAEAGIIGGVKYKVERMKA